MNKNIICMKNGVLACVAFKDLKVGDTVYIDDKPIVIGVEAHCSGDMDDDGWLAHCEAGANIFPGELDHELGEIEKDIICNRDGKIMDVHFRELRVGDIVYKNNKPIHIDEDAHHSPGEGDYNRWLAYDKDKKHILPEDLDCITI